MQTSSRPYIDPRIRLYVYRNDTKSMLVSSYLLETDSKPIQPETKFIFPFLAEPLFLASCIVHHRSLDPSPPPFPAHRPKCIINRSYRTLLMPIVPNNSSKLEPASSSSSPLKNLISLQCLRNGVG